MSTQSEPTIAVIVTGVGAIIGQGIVDGLRKSRHNIRIIGIDRNEHQPGPSICDLFLKKPSTDETSRDYLAFWLETIRREAVSLILPGLEVDVEFLTSNRTLLESAGSVVALNKAELIALCNNKWRLGQALAQEGLPTIPSIQTADWQEAIEFLGAAPLLLKPICGNGSRGIVRLKDQKDFDYWRSVTDGDWMLQKIVGSDDEEYTVGMFGLGDGRGIEPIIFRRRLSAAGYTQKADVIEDALIHDASLKLTKIFKPLGPTNFQFRKCDNVAFLLEINPRFSSSASLRTAFGYNEASMAVEFFLLKSDPPPPTIVPGNAWRFTKDFIVYDRNSR